MAALVRAQTAECGILLQKKCLIDKEMDATDRNSKQNKNQTDGGRSCDSYWNCEVVLNNIHSSRTNIMHDEVVELWGVTVAHKLWIQCEWTEKMGSKDEMNIAEVFVYCVTECYRFWSSDVVMFFEIIYGCLVFYSLCLNWNTVWPCFAKALSETWFHFSIICISSMMRGNNITFKTLFGWFIASTALYSKAMFIHIHIHT